MHSIFLTTVFAGKVTQAFCWMLIHSLWQGLLFTIITGVVIMLTRRSGAVVRYSIVIALFFLFITVCCFTFIIELSYASEKFSVLQNVNLADTNETSLQYFLKSFIDYSSSHASLIVMVWFIIFCLKGIKMTTALVYNRQVKNRKMIPSECWINKITSLCKQLKIKKTVLLFESGIIKIPVVLGHLKPIIFIPVGMLTNLHPGEVEAVLLHELAHIRRNDYFVNIIQVIAETIFFFNPAMLWMSELLREERENCCDDIAVAHSGNKKQYIQALISFKEHALYATSYTTAFPAPKNLLLKRVTRIVLNRNNALDPAGKMFFLISLLVSALLLVAATAYDTNITVKKRVKKEEPAAKLVSAVNVPLADTKRIVTHIKHDVVIKKSKAKHSYTEANFISDIHASVSKRKQVGIEVNNKKIIAANSVIAAIPAEQTQELAASKLFYQQQAEIYRQQAEKDREQASANRKQADFDRIQAQKDREQADKDRKQATLDRQQAEKDKQQAEKDRQRAEKETEFTLKEKAFKDSHL